MGTLAVSINDRIVLRDRLWIVRQVTEVGDDRRLLRLEVLDDDEPASLDVATPPEELYQLPAETPTFDLAQLDSLAAWANAYRILAATLVHNVGLVSGARFGRVMLEAYQLAPALRLLHKPRPSLLIADAVSRSGPPPRARGGTRRQGAPRLSLHPRSRCR